MPSGQYTIDDTSRSRGDTSFRACVIGMLIFLLFCVTIIIVLLLVKKDIGRKAADGSKLDGTASKHTGDEGDKEDRGGSENVTSTISPSSEDTESLERSSSESTDAKTSAETRNFTSTSTEHPRGTADDSGDRSDSEGPGDDSTGNITNTSSESPSSTSINPTTLPVLRGSPEESDVASTSSESPANTSTEPSPLSEPRSSPEKSVEETDDKTELPTGSVEAPTTPSLPPPPPPKPVPCESAECKKLSTFILSTMGLEADPCKQFYEYACGGLRENKYLLQPDYEDEAWQRITGIVDKIGSSSPESYQKFKTLIQSCHAYDPVKDINMWKDAVRTEMMDLGDFALDDKDFSKNFTRLFLGLLQHDRPLIFEVTLDINDKAPSKFAVKIIPAQMAENPLYPEDNGALECQYKAANKYKDLDKIYQETLNCMNDIGKTKAFEGAKEALLTLGIFNASNEVKLNQTLNEYVEFLDLNTEALDDRAALRLELQNRQPELKTVKEMDEIFHKGLMVNWSAIIEKLIGRVMLEDERVQLYSSRYFLEINNKFELKHRLLHNALLVAFVAARYHDLVVSQRWGPHIYDMHCTRLAARLLPDVASALYLYSFPGTLGSHLEQEASNFVFEITNTFLDEIKRAFWLNDSTTETLKRDLEYKIMSITDSRNLTDHMSDIMDSSKLDVALSHYTIDKAELIKNAIMLMARNRERLYKRIDEEPINNIWTHFMPPYGTTGFSLYSLNFIAIPLGAIQKPFFDSDYLRHIRIAGLGFTVAHEMAHHIDSLGIKFNTSVDGKIIAKYKANIPSFVVFKDINIEYMNLTGPKKYNDLSFKFSDTERMLKDNEVFADKIAIQLAYKMYKKKAKTLDEILPYLPLTNDQSFFVFLAQQFCTKKDYYSMVIDFFESPECPPETRVKNMIDGNAAFYNAFNCSVPDKTDFPFPYIPVIEDDVDGA